MLVIQTESPLPRQLAFLASGVDDTFVPAQIPHTAVKMLQRRQLTRTVRASLLFFAICLLEDDRVHSSAALQQIRAGQAVLYGRAMTSSASLHQRLSTLLATRLPYSRVKHSSTMLFHDWSVTLCLSVRRETRRIRLSNVMVYVLGGRDSAVCHMALQTGYSCTVTPVPLTRNRPALLALWPRSHDRLRVAAQCNDTGP